MQRFERIKRRKRMKRNIIITSLLILLLSGCATSKFIISTDLDQELEISENNSKILGIVQKGDTLELKMGYRKDYIFIAKNKNGNEDEFFGTISYGLTNDNKFEVFNNINARENNTTTSTELSGNLDQPLHVFLRSKTKRITFFNRHTGIGYFKITANQDNVDIYIDNKFEGKAGLGKPFIKKIETGQHMIEARKEYYVSHKRSYIIETNEVIPIHFELKEMELLIEIPDTLNMIQGRGNLTIGTEKSDYVITIKGMERIAPIELISIPAGEYIIKIQRPGINKSITVVIKPNENKFIDLDELYNN
jgi:hypothetical protein